MGNKDLLDQAQRIAQLLTLHRNNISDAFINHALGLEYASAGERDKAVHHFETVVSHHPDYVGTYYHLGKVLESVDETRAASIYEQGMQVARRLGDEHTWAELSAAAQAIKELK